MITENDVLNIAGLARIHLGKEELQHLTKDLGCILGYINKLETLDVSKINPMSHVFPIKNIFREDKIKTSLDQKETLSITENTYNGAFKVPQVIEES